MNRLTGLDALFLYIETPTTPMHVASLTTFSAPSPGDDVFDTFRRRTAERLDSLPLYRRRLEPTPFGLDHPCWAPDDEVDLDHHLRRHVLPEPGTPAQLRALVAELHAQPLDRERPLWEHHVIEGLEDGGFAVYVKVHHSTMDGVAGATILPTIFDLSPQGGPPPRAGEIALRETHDDVELARSALGDLIDHAARAVRALPALAKGLARIAPSLARDARYLLGYARGVPRTPFNVTISGERVFATCSLPLHEVKALAKSRGATINDVVMALSAGALRRYLQARGALPEAPLAAGVPASLRTPGDDSLDNQVVFTLSRLPTDVARPLPRLAAARRAGREAKTLFADLRGFLTPDVALPFAPLALAGLARLWAATGAADALPWGFNVVISNIPGPRQPMYCAGARATHYFPLSIPYNGGALNITVQSYLDTLDFGLVACARTVPDLDDVARYLVEDFAALRAADLALAKPDAVSFIDIDAPPPRLIAAGESQPKRRRRKAAAEASALDAEEPISTR